MRLFEVLHHQLRVLASSLVLVLPFGELPNCTSILLYYQVKCNAMCIQNNEKSWESPFYANGEISAENLVAKQKFGSLAVPIY